MSTKLSFRVYVIEHHTGHVSAILMRRDERWFEPPPPSAFNETLAGALDDLEEQLDASLIDEPGSKARYLWDEDFKASRTEVGIYPASFVDKRPVIGAQRIPLRLTYVSSKLKTGGFRVMLPRFGWWFLLEDLAAAEEVLRHAVTTAFLGDNPKWIFDFRAEKREYVHAWSPSLLARKRAAFTGAYARAPGVLDAVCERWVERAKKGRLEGVRAIDPPRDPVRITRQLARDPPISLLVVGPSGVGKTSFVRAVAHHLAKRPADTHVPEVFATTHERILAGQVYLGMWQQRCLDMVKALEGEGNYLYVGRLMPFATDRGDGTSLAQIFMPALQAEEVSLIAECTPEEFARIERASPALISSFFTIHLEPPAAANVVELVANLAGGSAAGAHRAVQHLDAFERAQDFPGKAFRFLSWLNEDGSTLNNPEDASKAYARYSGLPLNLISDSHVATSSSIADELKTRVVGQDRACDAAAEILARFKAGLNDDERPVGSLLFVGPTGVGKTELAKSLAQTLFGDAKSRLIRVDLSEYMTPGSAQRLLTSGERAQSLASAVHREPMSLVLLDEVEKAHPEVFDLLLAVLGEGRLTDSAGRLVDFRMTIIVMTSNLGAAARKPIGVARGGSPDLSGAVRGHFRPEFVGRLDKVLTFRALDEDDMLKIVDLEVGRATARAGFRERAIDVEVSPAARALLARVGHHQSRGARPLKRAIEERLITPIAVRMAKDPEFMNYRILVDTDGDALSFT